MGLLQLSAWPYQELALIHCQALFLHSVSLLSSETQLQWGWLTILEQKVKHNL